MLRRFFSGILSFTLLIVSATSSTIGAGKCQDGGVILRPREGDPDFPRSPLLHPFIVYHQGESVYFVSTSTCGEVTLVLTSTGGDYYSTLYTEDQGTIIIPLSGNERVYTLVVVMESGMELEGKFKI